MESKITKKVNKKPHSTLELKHDHFVPDLPFPLDEDLVITYFLCKKIGSSVRIIHSSCDFQEVRSVMDESLCFNPRQDLFICKFISSLQRLTL